MGSVPQQATLPSLWCLTGAWFISGCLSLYLSRASVPSLHIWEVPTFLERNTVSRDLLQAPRHVLKVNGDWSLASGFERQDPVEYPVLTAARSSGREQQASQFDSTQALAHGQLSIAFTPSKWPSHGPPGFPDFPALGRQTLYLMERNCKVALKGIMKYSG